jgi:hypothetical protein
MDDLSSGDKKRIQRLGRKVIHPNGPSGSVHRGLLDDPILWRSVGLVSLRPRDRPLELGMVVPVAFGRQFFVGHGKPLEPITDRISSLMTE